MISAMKKIGGRTKSRGMRNESGKGSILVWVIRNEDISEGSTFEL